MNAVIEPEQRAAMAKSVAVHRRVAAYTLTPALDARLFDLGERKESLTPAEQEVLLALVAFTQARSVEKLEAELAAR